MKYRVKLLFILIILFGSALRFYNLSWGAPYFFHPDERNIAGSISLMYWEKTLNPQFFAYGSFWNYIVLFILRFLSFFPNLPDLSYFPHDPFIRAIILLRLFSALQGIGLIILSYFIGKLIVSRLFKFHPSTWRIKLLILPFLIATSPGLIQASHFGTFEQSLAFLYALIFYLSLKYLATRKFIIWFLICVCFGISISIRVTSIILIPILLFALIISKKKSLISPTILISLFSFFLIPLAIFFFSNPYSFDFSRFQIPASLAGGLDSRFRGIFSPDFLSTMKYESEVALGTMQVFYAQQFNQTTPFVYQFLRVLPFVLNPIVWIIFILSLIVPLASIISHIPHMLRLKSVKIKAVDTSLILTLLFFGATFFSSSLLFVKWTRYAIPSLPFIYIFIFLFLIKFLKSFFLCFLSFICIVFAFFFTSIYSFDTRIAAAKWAGNNLKPNVRILSEVYDMGIVPFNEVFPYQNIVLFNFYEMDDKFNDAANLVELKNLLSQADAIILPSRRVTDTRLRLLGLYPNGNWFYKNLFAGNLGFRLVKTFSHPYDKILPGIVPDESFTVFDHPDIYIFKKK